MDKVDKKFWTIERQLKFPKAFDAYIKYGWKGSVCTNFETGEPFVGRDVFEEIRLSHLDYEYELTKRSFWDPLLRIFKIR